MSKIEYWQLKQRQGLDLNTKVALTKKKIIEFYDKYNGNVYIAFSGGKDSTVLLDIVRKLYPDVPAVFSDTGLEYPEIKEFVKTFNNVETVRPKINFRQVIQEYGYPVISKKVARQIRDLRNPTDKNKNTRRLYMEGIKRDGTKTKSFKLSKKWHKLINAPFKVSEQCCNVMKKNPLKEYEKKTGRKPIIGTMVSDSLSRESSYLNTGCNNFKLGHSSPMGFWLEKDVWGYIKKNKLKYCSIYDTGVKRTGCIYCMFGIHLEKGENRFQNLKRTHPKLHDYCINNLECGKVCDYIGVKY